MANNNNNNQQTYAVSIPALVALASNADDTPANGIAIGDIMDDNHVEAAERQYANRKRLASCDAPLATAQEVLAAKRRRHQVQSVHFDGNTPVWAQQMQAQMQQMQAQMQAQFLELKRLIKAESERSRNLARKTTKSAIHRLVRIQDGEYPPNETWFPANQTELIEGNNNRVTALLQFYGLALDGTVRVKRERLAEHLGVIL